MVKVIESVPCVRVSFSQLVSTLMAVPFEVQIPILVQRLMISRSSSMVVKVIGQRSRSPGQKCYFWQFNLGVFGTIIGLCVLIHHGKRTLGRRNFNNVGGGRCVNAQAFSSIMILPVLVQLSH